jgi:transposase
MSRNTRYSPELRERAVRMAIEKRADYPSEWATFTGVAKLFGMSPETLRTWVRRDQVDHGTRVGLTTDERARLKALERENRDLRRANEILKDASIFFATELDGRTKR